jgi:hypothetical protein
VQEKGVRKKIYNHELYELFNDLDIVKYIKINRLGWVGLVVISMDNNRTVKKAFNTKPVGLRKTGRPKLRWEDDVIQDIKTLGVKNWRKLAEVSEEGQGPRGAVEQMMMMMTTKMIMSCVGRGLCNGLITCPKETYQAS